MSKENKKEIIDLDGEQVEVVKKLVFDKEAASKPTHIDYVRESTEFCGTDEKTVEEIKKMDEENKKGKKKRR